MTTTSRTNLLGATRYDGGMFLTSDLDAAIAWWATVAGTEVAWRSDDGVAQVRYAHGGALTLVGLDGFDAASDPAVRFCLEAYDAPALVEELRARGVAVGPGPDLAGVASWNLEGPDGQVVHVVEAPDDAERDGRAPGVRGEIAVLRTQDVGALVEWLGQWCGLVVRTHDDDGAVAVDADGTRVLVERGPGAPVETASARPYFLVPDASAFLAAYTAADAAGFAAGAIEGDPEQFGRFALRAPRSGLVHVWTFA